MLKLSGGSWKNRPERNTVNYDKGASLGASVVTYAASNTTAKGITSSTPGWSKVQIKASGVDLMSMDQDEVLYGFGGVRIR